jgi:hypothetical protein
MDQYEVCYIPPTVWNQVFNPMCAHQILFCVCSCVHMHMLKSDGAISKQEKINIKPVQT